MTKWERRERDLLVIVRQRFGSPRRSLGSASQRPSCTPRPISRGQGRPVNTTGATRPGGGDGPEARGEEGL